MVTAEQPNVTPGSAKESRLVELLKKVRDDVSGTAGFSMNMSYSILACFGLNDR